jgi:predicted O-methyltransferase YrrM
MIPTFDEVMVLTGLISGSPALEEPEARALYKYCVLVPPGGVVVETGCQLGRSSSLIAQLARAIGFHSFHIDPYCCEPPGVAFPSEEYLQSWVAMMRKIGGEHDHAFTLLCMRTDQADWHLSKIGPIDLAFIDGDHEQIGVEIDMNLVASRIKPGGILTAHDYTNPGLLGVAYGVNQYVGAGGWDAVGVFGSLGVWRKQ